MKKGDKVEETPATRDLEHRRSSTASQSLSMYTLCPNESLTVFFRASHISPSKCDTDAVGVTTATTTTSARQTLVKHNEDFAPHHSYVTYPCSSELSCTQSPYSALVRVEKAIMMEEDRVKLLLNPSAVVADLGAKDKLDIVSSWTADNGKSGLFLMPGLACMKSQPAACSLKVLVEYENTVTHEFSSHQKPLEVPVKVLIRNILEEETVSFLFETLKPQEDFDYNKRSFKVISGASLNSRYLWKGDVRRQIKDLKSNEVVTLSLVANFFQPGQYNLNR